MDRPNRVPHPPGVHDGWAVGEKPFVYGVYREDKTRTLWLEAASGGPNGLTHDATLSVVGLNAFIREAKRRRPGYRLRIWACNRNSGLHKEFTVEEILDLDPQAGYEDSTYYLLELVDIKAVEEEEDDLPSHRTTNNNKTPLTATEWLAAMGIYKSSDNPGLATLKRKGARRIMVEMDDGVVSDWLVL